MADTAAAKEKPKKKKAPATNKDKDKEKETRRVSGAGTDVEAKTDAEKATAEPAEVLTAPDTSGAEVDKHVEEHKKPKEKKQSKKEKKKMEEGEQEEKSDGSRKPSVVEKTDSSRKSSLVDPSTGSGGAAVDGSGGSVDVDADEGEDGLLAEKEIHSSYVVPPSATKKDINLLTDLDESKLQELKEAFELFDLNQDGYIDASDLKLTFQTLGHTDIADEEILDMLSEAINPMDFEAFVILLGYKTIEMDPEAILVEALSQWDYNNSGLISEERIKHDLMTWGDKFTKEEAEMALEDAPVYVNKKTGAAMIDYLKFCNTLSGLRKKTKMPGPEDFITNK